MPEKFYKIDQGVNHIKLFGIISATISLTSVKKNMDIAASGINNARKV
jgi:hypothetical protein